MMNPISSGLLPASEKLLSEPATEGARHTITVLLITVQFYRRREEKRGSISPSGWRTDSALVFLLAKRCKNLIVNTKIYDVIRVIKCLSNDIMAGLRVSEW